MIDACFDSGFRRAPIPKVATLAAGVLLFGTVSAGEWDITPRVTVVQEHSDNVTLVDQNTLSDFITTLTPGVSLRGNSAKLQTNVDYNMQNLIYGDNDNFDRTNHQLQSNALATLIDNVLTFNAQASLSQQTISNRGQFAISNRSQTGNQTDVLFYEFSPRFQHHFGRWADFSSTYRHAETEFGDGSAGTGDEETIEFELTSGDRIAKTPLKFSYTEREANFDSGRVNETKRFLANLSYIFSRKLTLTLETGVDENSFSGNSNGNDGFRWKFGGTWNPGPRTSIAGHFGERGFGETFDVKVNHRHRRFTFDLNYQENLRTIAQRQRELVLIPLTDSNNLPIFDINASSNILTPVNTASVNEEVSLSRTLRIDLNYFWRRSSINAGYFQTDRTFQSSLVGEETRGFNVNWQRTLRPRLTATANFSWRESIIPNGRGSNEVMQFSPGLNYELGPHTSTSLRYQYVDSTGDQSFNSFLENAITANLSVYY